MHKFMCAGIRKLQGPWIPRAALHQWQQMEQFIIWLSASQEMCQRLQEYQLTQKLTMKKEIPGPT